MKDSIVELVTNTKFVIAVLAVVVVTLLAVIGRVTGTEALGFVKWIATAWLGAQAIVEAAAKPEQLRQLAARNSKLGSKP